MTTAIRHATTVTSQLIRARFTRAFSPETVTGSGSQGAGEVESGPFGLPSPAHKFANCEHSRGERLRGPPQRTQSPVTRGMSEV